MLRTDVDDLLGHDWLRQQDGSAIDDHVFKEVVAHSPFAVIVGAPDGRIFYANPAACALFGGSEDDLRRVGRQGVTNPSLASWQSLLTERRGTGRALGVAPMNRLDGSVFLGEVASAIVELPDGTERTCVIIHDVTERIRLERNSAALNDVVGALLFGAEPSIVLALVARHAQIIFDASDAAVVTAAEPPDDVVVAAAYGTRLSKLLGRRYSPGTLSRRVMDSGRAVGVDSLSSVARTEEARRLELGPAMLAPIVSGQQTLGVLYVGAEPERPPFDSKTLTAFGTFAERAGLALAIGDARAEAERHQVRRADQLQHALDSRIVIEQAKGVVSALRSISVAEAFNRIRGYARSHSQDIHEVARAVVERDLLL